MVKLTDFLPLRYRHKAQKIAEPPREFQQFSPKSLLEKISWGQFNLNGGIPIQDYFGWQSFSLDYLRAGEARKRQRDVTVTTIS